jgi:cytidine deaminase
MRDWTDLIERACRIAERAHAPYSNFRVGTVVIADDGSEYAGCNVENAAYGSSICAEANAIATAITEGRRKIDTVVVASPDDDDPLYPCGNCRQLMKEFDVERVIVQDGRGGWLEHRFDDLFPYSFGPEDME